MRVLEALAALCARISAGPYVGGALLNEVAAVASEAGDEKTQALYLHLAHEAARPYLRMLEDWVYRGSTNDPFGVSTARRNAMLAS